MREFHDGQRVTHRSWTNNGQPQQGTVHVFADAAPDEASAEVRWDGTCVADELDLVADDID